MGSEPETTAAVGWRMISAVVIGSDHRRDGSLCQDAAVVKRVVADDGEHLVAVASDGAGSAKFGGEGAKLTCEIAAELGLDAWKSKDIGTTLLDAIRAAIGNEATRLGANPSDFACTLLAACIGPSGSTFVQVGDGAMVAATPEGGHAAVFWPTKGEYANQTIFVTSPGAATHLQCRIDGGSCDEVALLTDGLEHLALDFSHHMVFEGFFAPFFGAVRELPAGDPDTEMALSSELGDFLASARVDAATGDDRTLIVASRRGA
jgi:hypothetical protein